MDASTLADRVAAVRQRAEAARTRAGRCEPVEIVAVTKTHPAEMIPAVREAGICDVGENRVGELGGKIATLGRDAARWHLIGHLQRNKVRKALPLFDLLHSLDSLRLARVLSHEAERAERAVSALVQINAAGEQSKGGFGAEETLDAIGEILEMPGIRLLGLMTMAPWTEDEKVLRTTFRRTHRVWEEARSQFASFEALHLSMGMSNDFEIAVEEGSTMIRVGTVLFGDRPA